MNRSEVNPLAVELLDVLERLIALEERLSAAIREKLDAMRRADVDGMTRASREEGRLVEGIAALDEVRGARMDRLCVLLAPARTKPSLRELATMIGGAAGERLTRVAADLRGRMLRVAEANRVVELASRSILDHFKHLFAAMARDESTAPTYSAAGQLGRVPGARVLDSVV